MTQLIGPRLFVFILAWSFLLVGIGVGLGAATGSAIPLFAIFPEMVGTAIFLGLIFGFKLRGQAKQAIAEGKDPFVELGFSTAQLWGFKSGAGPSVGGGFYTKAELEEGEETVISVVGAYSRNRWIVGHGYLTLTNRRFIFTGSRLPLLLTVRRAIVPYAEVDQCVVRRVISLGAWVGSLTPAVVLTTPTGSHYLWPAVLRRDTFAQRLVDLKRESEDKSKSRSL